MYISRAVGNLEGFRQQWAAVGSSGQQWSSRWDALRIRQGDFGKSLGGPGGSSGQQWAPGSRCI